jgi:hypothetical protein
MKDTAWIGFQSLTDYFTSLLGIKTIKLNMVFAILFSVTGFIQNYIFNNAQAVYFMLFLLGVDFVTGIYKAVKSGNFSSSRLPRVFVITLSYSLMLAISWNAAKYSEIFSFLPGVVYGGLIATLLVSIFENLYLLGLLPKSFFDSVMSKLKKKD